MRTSGLLPPDIVRAAFCELQVTDIDRSRWFWVDVIGMAVTAEHGGRLYLRGYEELTHHNLVLSEGPFPACRRLSFRVRTPSDVDRAERYFSALECPVERVPSGTTAGMGPSVLVEDPLGFTVEFFHDIGHPERLTQRYDIRRGADISRLDHFNISVPDVERAYRHYERLGFGCSETIEGEDQRLYAAWMYRKQTVHDVAFTSGDGPRLHHLGFFAHESHQILRLCDSLGAQDLETHIERGPGRHGVSNAFYVYLRDPDGHRLEIYTSDYYTGDPDHETLRWDVKDPKRRDFWGNAVIESWYRDASPVCGLDGRVRPLNAYVLDEVGAQVGADGLGTSGPVDVPPYPSDPRRTGPRRSTRRRTSNGGRAR
ncbi:MAG: 3,4-dihydroxyphenylacetate 2,3-dioxygenase [Acidimicrobiales bacterium]